MRNNLLFIYTVSLMAVPQIHSGQIPPLNAASSFALFTVVGAFTNAGPSTIVTGDIGTNGGALTGFPPGKVIGQIHVADSVSAQASMDVVAAYDHLGSLTCDTSIGSVIGYSDTLAPKVYCAGSALTLNGELILDGKGNTNAVFIFKIGGAMTVSASARVTLINSASHHNIYWQVNGAVGFGDSAIFNGTVISNGALNLYQGSFIQGRALSTAGAIYIHNSISTLPVKLLTFQASCSDQTILLKWISATEINNDYYSIERCTDIKSWQVIGIVDGSGNSSTLKNYYYSDREPNKGMNYYRLKQTDFDGKFDYSALASTGNCGEYPSELTIYPNPTTGQFNLSFNHEKGMRYPVSIYNMIGKNVYNSENYQSTIYLSDLEEGVYFLHFDLASKHIIRKLMIKE